LSVTPLTQSLSKRYGYEGQFAFDKGLVVTEVKPNSPAEEAGIEKGDLITRYVKNQSIHDADSQDEFDTMLKSQDEIAVWLEDVNHRLPGEFKPLTKPHPVKK